MLPQIHAHLPTQLGGAAANQVLQMSHPATHAGLDHFKIRACGTCCLRHECNTSDNQIQNLFTPRLKSGTVNVVPWLGQPRTWRGLHQLLR